MVNNNKDKFRLAMMVVITLAVLVSAIILMMAIGFNAWPPIMLVTLIIVGMQIGILIWLVKRSKEVREGFPLHDERTKRIMDKASSRTFYFMIYFLLFLGWISDDGIESLGIPGLIGRHVTAAAILGGAIVFFLLVAYYSRKADV